MLVLSAPNLAQSGIAHGFFGRKGGVSTGIFASLNCGPGSGDDRQSVTENRALVEKHLATGAKLLTLYQIHSPNAVIAREPWEMGAGPQADAMVTNMPGLALGILTADCAPVLLADAEAKVVGAAHAGWKGALGGVVEAAVAAMEQIGARRESITAAVGPRISQANYEVGPEFRPRFVDTDSSNARFFTASDRPDHWRFDLEGYVVHRLKAAGVASVHAMSACTYAQEADFFSYRRATHRGEKDCGRQVSAILLI